MNECDRILKEGISAVIGPMSQTNRHSWEAEATFSKKRIQTIEKHLGLICHTVGSITRKNARLRNKGDLLTQYLVAFAESDQMNPSAHVNILRFAENYAAVQDYLHAKVQRMEAKVLKPLTRYGEICKYLKRNVKSEIAACGKERKLVQKIEKLRGKADKQTQIKQVELEIQHIRGEKELIGEAMETEVDMFEKNKLTDVKNILAEMVKIEMLYHAKALEYLSRCFENIEQINVETDFNAFQAGMAKLRGKGQTGMIAQPLSSSSVDPSQQSTTIRELPPSRQSFSVKQSPHVQISSSRYHGVCSGDSEDSSAY